MNTALRLPTAGIVLASQSPRRLQLLQQMALPVVAMPVDIDETPYRQEAPATYVARMSDSKCAAARPLVAPWLTDGDSEPRLLLAADTIVVSGGQILGKPRDVPAAKAMLTQLSDAEHQVMTSVTIASAHALRSAVSVATVRFRALTPADIDAYVATGEGLDKAGSYGIQGIGGIFAEHISGSYSAVVGLPIATVETLLTDMGIDTWRLRTNIDDV
ncbi:MAG: nucleoside triphosphate pyrophosphatase [Pseudomonadales bacterium]